MTEFSGPIDYVVFGFRPEDDLSAGLQALLDRVQQGIIEILDIEIVSRDATGAAVRSDVTELTSAASIDLSIFEGVGTEILDVDDLASIAAVLEADQFAIAIVYEDRSLAVAANAWFAAGAVELLAGGVDIADLELALAPTSEEGTSK